MRFLGGRSICRHAGVRRSRSTGNECGNATPRTLSTENGDGDRCGNVGGNATPLIPSTGNRSWNGSENATQPILSIGNGSGSAIFWDTPLILSVDPTRSILLMAVVRTRPDRPA